jgi:hypothetical protein
MTTSSQPIACTLTGASLQNRIDWIARLARDALRSHERDDLTLRLRYAPDAVESVRRMVREEQVCCAFLEFELEESPNELLLTICAPEAARKVADQLFAHFCSGDPASLAKKLPSAHGLRRLMSS